MTRDNALYTLLGLLAGFISGYFVHEMVAARQPPRAIAQPGAPAPAPGPGAPAAQTGPPMEEVARLREYVAQNPDDADAVLALANLSYDVRDWTRAQELYARYLELRPEDPNVLTDLGTTYRNQGRFEEALEQFDRAQELDATHWQSLYNEIVVQAFDLGRADRAEELLERLRILQPDNPEVDRLAQEVERRAAGPPVEAAS